MYNECTTDDQRLRHRIRRGLEKAQDRGLWLPDEALEEALAETLHEKLSGAVTGMWVAQ